MIFTDHLGLLYDYAILRFGQHLGIRATSRAGNPQLGFSDLFHVLSLRLTGW